jgi:hypothetical protein
LPLVLVAAIFPLLAPYWLFQPQARREFPFFKGYTLASFGLLVASLVAQYQVSFLPELGVQSFLPIAAGTFAVETVLLSEKEALVGIAEQGR